MKLDITVLVLFSFVICNGATAKPEIEQIICKEFSEDPKVGGNNYLYEDIISEIIENLRKLLREGDEEKGIPSFDPLVVADKKINLNNQIINGNLELTNLTPQGIPDFNVTEGSMTIRGDLKLGFSFEEILLTTNYTGNLKLFDTINIYGTGQAIIKFTGFEINVEAAITLVPVRIKSVKLVLVLPAVDAKLTGLLDNEYMSYIISRLLSCTLTNLAKEQEERINKIINDRLEQIVENLTKNFKQLSDEHEIAASEACYSIVTIVKQMAQILTEENFIMNSLTKNYFN